MGPVRVQYSAILVMSVRDAYKFSESSEDEVFIATGAAIFHGAHLGKGSQIRINAVVHLKSYLESANRCAKVLINQLKGESVDRQKEYADYLMAGVDTFRTYANAWYDGRLPAIFFSPQQDPDVRNQICSVLAGYVWDKQNPYLTQHDRAVSSLAKVVALMNK